MKVDFDTRLKSLDGREIKRFEAVEGGPPVAHDWPAGHMAADAVLTPAPQADRGGTSVQQITQRYELARRLYAGGVVEITASEAVQIQQAVARTYAPLIAAQLIALLEGKDDAA